MNGFLPHLNADLRPIRAFAAFPPQAHTVTLDNAACEVIDCSSLISTMPRALLIRAISPAAPPNVREAAERLRYTSVRCVNIGVARENLTR